MDPFDPSRPGMVQTEDAQTRCIALYKLSRKGDEAEAKTALDNLGTWYEFAWELRKVRRDTPYGEWGPFLERAGISPREASEAIRMVENLSKPAVMALGSKTKVKEHLREHFPDEDDAEEGETKSGGGADLPKTGGGSSRGARKRKGKRSGGTGPSPKSQQQTLALDPEEAQERMEDDMRRFLRGLADEIEDISERLQYKLRLDTQAAEELRRISRDSLGSLGEFRKIDPPEAAAGFEGRVLEPVKEEWRVLDVLLRVLAQVGGKE